MPAVVENDIAELVRWIVGNQSGGAQKISLARPVLWAIDQALNMGGRFAVFLRGVSLPGFDGSPVCQDEIPNIACVQFNLEDSLRLTQQYSCYVR